MQDFHKFVISDKDTSFMFICDAVTLLMAERQIWVENMKKMFSLGLSKLASSHYRKLLGFELFDWRRNTKG